MLSPAARAGLSGRCGRGSARFSGRRIGIYRNDARRLGGRFPLTVFAPFILDASITLGRRVLRGEKFWQAHREHYYQLMIRMSKGHAITVRIWYVVMLLGAGFALAGLRIGIQAQWSIFGLWSGALLMCGWEVDRRWHVWTRLNRL